jgi:hypothetical protein
LEFALFDQDLKSSKSAGRKVEAIVILGLIWVRFKKMVYVFGSLSFRQFRFVFRCMLNFYHLIILWYFILQ